VVGLDKAPSEFVFFWETQVRIALYGGSFNPPHRAHALVAEWVVQSGAADEVWLVPVYQHALDGQQGKQLAPFTDRLAWCAAMAASLSVPVRVCDVESRLPVPSYSIDTLDHLAKTHPAHGFRLVVGADILDQTDQWKRWDEIEVKYAPLVVGRAGYPAPEGVPVFPAVSSTDVRARLTSGDPVDELVVPAVLAALQKGHPWRP
jgi:nicotinate-nucleotide adenylyltransferase